MVETEKLRREFIEQHGREPRLFRAPGRVNLIGEHTDYNDGFVLPMAIDRETIVAAAARDDRRVRVRSLNTNREAEFDLDQPGPVRRSLWLDYVEGVAQSLEARGVRLVGANMILLSDVPVGAGLSSSAALEISVGLALASLSNADVDMKTLALAGQSAEHNYVGIRSGIMDQFIAALGRAAHALLIDCRALDSTLIPLDTTQTAVVVCDTRVKHQLASSEYNVRREECERGVELLREFLPDIRALRDVSVEEFEKYADRLPEVIRRRSRHVVTENARTLRAVEALRAGEMDAMGRLMARSHESLRDDYQVSCRELDLMVEIARSVAGVAGARMTGGGFGGCTVNLVSRSQLETFQQTVAREYEKATMLAPAIYVVEASNGACEISA